MKTLYVISNGKNKFLSNNNITEFDTLENTYFFTNKNFAISIMKCISVIKKHNSLYKNTKLLELKIDSIKELKLNE